MVKQLIYTNETQPEDLKTQTLSFLRIQWPEGFIGKNRLRDWITPDELHPLHFVAIEERMLVSHIEVVWKYLEHNGIQYKIYGLTGVFTYPQFRGEGHAKKLLKEATAYVLQSDADIAMFHCGEDLVSFYETSDWEVIRTARTLIGPIEQPHLANGVMMTFFLTEKGKKGKNDFETKEFYFGGDTW